MSGTNVFINSEEVKSFQKDINQLAATLQQYKNTLERNLKALSNDWKDAKYQQFESSFRSKKEQIQEISIFMKKWSDTYLRDTYEKMLDYEKSNMH